MDTSFPKYLKGDSNKNPSMKAIMNKVDGPKVACLLNHDPYIGLVCGLMKDQRKNSGGALYIMFENHVRS